MDGDLHPNGEAISSRMEVHVCAGDLPSRVFYADATVPQSHKHSMGQRLVLSVRPRSSS
jgi:hypothetical protein